MKDIVIIGGGVAGLTAAIAAKDRDDEAKVTVISEEKISSYRRASLPGIIDGTSKFQDITVLSGELNGITLLKGAKVLNVDVSAGNVAVKEDGGAEKTLTYDSLILSTGANPALPSINGIESKSVCALRTFDDAVRISEAKRNVTVVGAGFIALMIAEALIRRGIKVNLIVRSRILRGIVEPEISEYVERKMIDYGVNVMTGATPEEIVERNGKTYLNTSKGDVESSMIIFSTGVTPNIELAKNAGIKIGRRGIETDEQMRTSLSNVYAAGDCAEVVEAITKKMAYIPLASIAAKGGKIAGMNAAGGEERGDFMRMQNEEIFDINIVTMGYTEDDAREVVDKRAKKMRLNGAYVITDGEDRVIGASCLYTRISSPYINALYDTIKEGKSFAELQNLFGDPSKKIDELMREEVL